MSESWGDPKGPAMGHLGHRHGRQTCSQLVYMGRWHVGPGAQDALG